MNKVILIGRWTRDPEVRYSNDGKAVAKGSIAIDRKFNKDEADFPSITAFGKTAEFIEKYFRKGMKIAIVGRLQTGSYDDKDGKKVYTTDVIVEEADFVESKAASNEIVQTGSVTEDGFTDAGAEADAVFNY